MEKKEYIISNYLRGIEKGTGKLVIGTQIRFVLEGSGADQKHKVYLDDFTDINNRITYEIDGSYDKTVARTIGGNLAWRGDIVKRTLENGEVKHYQIHAEPVFCEITKDIEEEERQRKEREKETGWPDIDKKEIIRTGRDLENVELIDEDILSGSTGETWEILCNELDIGIRAGAFGSGLIGTNCEQVKKLNERITGGG